MERPNLWLALSGIPPDVIPSLLLMMKANRQQTDDPVLEMLQRMLYSQFGFITCPSRLKMLVRCQISTYLMHALLQPGLKVGVTHRQTKRLVGCMIQQVKKKFSSPSHYIVRTMQILSKPSFQLPVFHLNFSIEYISDWCDQTKLILLTNILLAIPDDFVGLPDLLVLVRHLIITDNPLWKTLVDLFICNEFDSARNSEAEYDIRSPDVLKKLEDDCTIMFGSPEYIDFVQLFQYVEHGLERVPIEVIERFLKLMIDSLSIFPDMRFDSSTSMVHFLFNMELSPDGIDLSLRIYQRIKCLHSLSIPSSFMKLLDDMNNENSPQCLVYRGLEVLFHMILLLQQSNSLIYTYIHAYILIETSEIWKRRQICAWRDLFTIVRALIINLESVEFETYGVFTMGIHRFLRSGKSNNPNYQNEDAVIPFFIDVISTPEFLSLLQTATTCLTRETLEKFAEDLMMNQIIVGIFQKYIQENPKTWIRC